MSSLTITMSPMPNCRDDDVVHLGFCCREVIYFSFKRFQNCRAMLTMASIYRLSDEKLSVIHFCRKIVLQRLNNRPL